MRAPNLRAASSTQGAKLCLPNSRSTMRLLIIRHAEPEPLSDACPDCERPLSALGRDQAERLARAVAHEKLDFVVSSTMRRAAETAAPVADLLGLWLRQEPALAEIDLGTLTPWGEAERARWAEVTGRWSSGDLHACCPQGESLVDVVKRVEPVVQGLLAEPCQDGFAVVAHSVVNHVILTALCPDLRPKLGQDLGHSHAGIWELEGVGQAFRVVRWNDTSHLGAV